jgi:hypothetical protein
MVVLSFNFNPSSINSSYSPCDQNIMGMITLDFVLLCFQYNSGNLSVNEKSQPEFQNHAFLCVQLQCW